MKTGLLTALASERDAVQTFSAILGEEQEALISGVLEALPALTERKASLTEQLAALGQTRDTRLTEMGYPVGRAGGEAAAAADADVARAWQALRDIAAQARQTNETNGLLIRSRLEYSRQALNALRAGNGDPLYGPDGRPQSAHGGTLATG